MSRVHCCGGLPDRVLADQFDRLDADCERIERRDITALDRVQDQEENRTEGPPGNDDEG
jgi:hypothetical protein